MRFRQYWMGILCLVMAVGIGGTIVIAQTVRKDYDDGKGLVGNKRENSTCTIQKARVDVPTSDDSFTNVNVRLEEINEWISAMSVAVVNNCADEETINLLKLFPRAEYVKESNAIRILLNVEESVLPYALGVKNDNPSDDVERLLMDYREGVTFLKESIQFDKCNFPIEIVLETGYEQGYDLPATATVDWEW